MYDVYWYVIVTMWLYQINILKLKKLKLICENYIGSHCWNMQLTRRTCKLDISAGLWPAWPSKFSRTFTWRYMVKFCLVLSRNWWNFHLPWANDLRWISDGLCIAMGSWLLVTVPSAQYPYPVILGINASPWVQQHTDHHMVARQTGPVQGCVLVKLIHPSCARIEGQQQSYWIWTAKQNITYQWFSALVWCCLDYYPLLAVQCHQAWGRGEFVQKTHNSNS